MSSATLQPTSRRSFLKAGAAFALLNTTALSQFPIERGRFSDDDVPLARERLLEMVNSERSQAGLSVLSLDDLACKVANDHARDMANGHFLSHWGSDGRKPYHRYSFAGGTDAVQENASSADNIQSLTPAGVFEDLHDMHTSMMAELPPNDGHRKTILFPYHTHVGFGLALNGYSLRLDELFLARYVQLDPIVREAKPKSTVFVTGRLFNASHFLNEVEIFYEPLPTSPDILWLRTPRSVSLPDSYVPLRPKVPEGTLYTDGSKGDFSWKRGGWFRVPIKLFKDEPGIYTILFWIRRVPSDKGFPGAEVCILSQ